MAKLKCRTWKRPPIGEKWIAHTGRGSFIIDGTTGSWRSALTRSQMAEKFLRQLFARKGWVPRTIKVNEFRAADLAQDQPGAFYLNIGYLRGLDPQAVANAIAILPDKCGHRRIMLAIAKVPERVEPAKAG
jgi:hypothetical protein